MSRPANPPLEKAIQPGEASNAKQDSSSNVLNSPEIGRDGKPTKRAITDAKQAHAIAKSIRDRAKDGRLKTAGVIAKKYNGDAPFIEIDLANANQTWRNNFSTNFLASIIDRVKPQFLDPLNKADVLTHSILPATIENAAAKSRTFCEVTTKVIRRWPAWKDFTSQLAQENVLFGLATPGWIDTDWRPRLWRFDEAFCPEGTGQHASKVQVCVFAQQMLIHEFIKLFEDRTIAEKAQYNVDNCIIAANKAKDNSGKGDETDLQKEDRKREGANLSDSFNSASKTVDLFHVIVQDYTGEVDIWTVTQDEGLEIRNVQALHKTMPDGITLFTFQSGNGKLYGSKGLGRLLTNLHIAVERGRCLGADQMYLSGLIVFKTDKKDAVSLMARVRHPFIFVDKNVDLVPQQITFDSTAFEMMDKKLSELAESIAGAFIPNLDQTGNANTKIEAAQNAERELAVKEGVLGRFFDHMADLVSAMQRKIYSAVNLREGKRAYDAKVQKEQSGIRVLMRKVWELLKDAFGADETIAPDNESQVADEEAVAAIVELLESGLTVEDIATLALSPSAQSNADEGELKDQKTLAYIAGSRINPHIDQRAATEMEAKIAIGEDRAKQLVIPIPDPNVEAIAIREQTHEFLDMMDGEPMPVAAGDRHEIHRKALAPKIQQLMPAVEQAPTIPLVKTARLMVSHYVDHISKDALMAPDVKKEEMGIMSAHWSTLDRAEAALAKVAEAAAAAGVPVGPDGLPVPVNGQPPQVGPNGQVIGEPPEPRGHINKDDSRHIIETKKIEQKDRELELKERDMDHQHTKDALDLQHRNVETTQKIVADAARMKAEEESRKEAAKVGAAGTG